MHHHNTASTEAQELTELAQRIVTEGAVRALHCNLSFANAVMWEGAARDYLTAQVGGFEDEEFAEMVDEFFNPARDATWALDQDFLHDERVSWGLAA